MDPDFSIVGFSNGIYCLASYDRDRSDIIYLWNPNIRKLKKLKLATPCPDKYSYVGFGFVFDSQNDYFKILRLVAACNDIGVVSIYPESLNQNILAIKDANWLAYIANSVESLILLDDDIKFQGVGRYYKDELRR
ncbi:uncharacterized protein LOC115961963 [Quercus lobata]|uniref:uncharacterized protein LOC115961963 n=1 Tax=Quercus lobata TaxID=97700 RepID=UPI0012460A0F|nr:uncharacterized protein LOC115961963 [Quercus lobata]